MMSDLLTMQDCGSFPTETSVGLDGATYLLRLSDLSEELRSDHVAAEGRELAIRVHSNISNAGYI